MPSSECKRVKLEVEVKVEAAITSKHGMSALTNLFGYYLGTYRPYLGTIVLCKAPVRSAPQDPAGTRVGQF